MSGQRSRPACCGGGRAAAKSVACWEVSASGAVAATAAAAEAWTAWSFVVRPGAGESKVVAQG